MYSLHIDGGLPELISNQWGFDGSYSPDGSRLVVDVMDRWDSEWRAYRGGQNTPLIILDIDSQDEILIPNRDRTTDVKPIWMKNKIYFLSDRDLVSNIWSYDYENQSLEQITKLKGSDIKNISGHDDNLIFERDGYIHLLNLSSKKRIKSRLM